MKKKAFTLVEILIAIVLAAILFTLIFRAYVRITEIATRMQHEKQLNAEITYLTETVQNIADTYQIDYSQYGTTLRSTNGRTKSLYLTGNGASGAALIFSGDNLLRVDNNETTSLISTGSALITEGAFKIIPFTKLPTDGFLDIQHPGFRLMAEMQTPKYNPQERIRDVNTSVQQFYTLQRVE